MKIIVISDTHIRDSGARKLPEKLIEKLDGADLILHAGDLMSTFLLDELEGYSPTFAICGNMDDPEERLPETREFEVEGVRVAMIHDSGNKTGRPKRMRRRFPEARVVIFGHSHIPLIEDDGELMLLNPGSPTDKRRSPNFTFAILEIKEGEVSAEIVRL